MEEKKCKHIECSNSPYLLDYCKFHYDGGVFGNGDTYEQYQVIEEDFLNFIKIIPLNDTKNLEVCSPVLRDLIIRCCVQIEIFFKEWSKYECSQNNELDLWELYSAVDKRSKTPKGARNWTFKNYYYFKEKYINQRELFVRDLDKTINPFLDWSINSPPNWWNTYNSIKHSGIESKRESNLEMALYSLCALFQLHCSNNYSRRYLEQFVSIYASKKTFGKIKIEFEKIKTPLDSKKYLFMDKRSSQKSFEIDESNEAFNRASHKGRIV